MTTAMDLIGTDEALRDHWIKRLIAIIIDYVIVSIPVAILAMFGIGFGFVFWSTQGLLFLVYFVITEAFVGASLGKKLLKLKVVALSDELDIGKVFIRNITKFNGFLLLVDFLVGFLTDGDPKQKYLDRVAGTTVMLEDMSSTNGQHIYQTGPEQHSPPPQQQYPKQHTPIYHQPETTAQPPPPPPPEGAKQCSACQGNLILTGDGRLQCIRCGKIS